MSSSTARGSWLSWLGWVAPVALIVGGLGFLAADIRGDGGVSSATPANAAEAARTHAGQYVARQAPAGASASLAGIVPVSAAPEGPSVYHLRLVVVSHESGQGPGRTVAFCVRWDVDVSTRNVVELAGVELSTDRGLHAPERRADEWRERCAGEVLL